MSETDFISLVLAFDADGEFVRGFEAGRLWTQLQDLEQRDELVGQPIHANNTEMLMRMGESLGLAIAAEPTDETWIAITAIEELVR